MSAIYTIFTSPDHPPVPDHLPTLIVTPSGKPAQILYTYLHTNYNRENYLLTPSPQGDLCVAKLFPPPIPSTRPSGGKSVSEGGHGSSAGSRTVKCEASRNFKWSITNSGVLTPSYKCTLPAEDLPGGVSDEQPLFQISKTNPSSPFWTMWYYAYAGHLIPPKRIQFGHISKNIGPDGKPITGGGTRVTITGKSEDEKAVWKTLGEGNEDMVEWAVICAALHVLDDEIVKAAESAGIRIGVMPGARTAPSNRATPPPNAMPRPVLHPTGLKGDRPPQAPAPPAGVMPSARGPLPPMQQQQQIQQQQQQQARMPIPPQQQQQIQQQQQRPPPSPSHGQFNRGPPPQQQQPPQQQPPQQRPMQNGDPRMGPPPQSQPGRGPPPPQQQPHYPHNLPQQHHPQQQQAFPPRQAQQSLPPPGSSMSPPMSMPDPRQRLGSKTGPRPVFSPIPDQQHPSPQMPHSPLPPSNGMRGPLPHPQQHPPQPNGNMGRSPPGQHLPLHNMGNRPPPHAQQNYPMQSNGQPMQNGSRMGGASLGPQGPVSPPNGVPPPRSAPPVSISALRNRSPLPAPGSSAPDNRMPPPMNGQARGQPHPGPARSAPPPELSEEDTVDSVAFMLGATALNDAADHRR